MFNPVFQKLISIFLLVAFPISVLASDCEDAKVEGENAASTQHSSAGWFLGGVGSGVLLGLIGTGVVTAAAAMTHPQPKLIPDNIKNQNCYINGYSKKGKSKNTLSALCGGLVGTAVFVVIYVSAQNNSN